MIFPIIHGILRFHQAPVVWMLVLINAWVFLSVDVRQSDNAYYKQVLRDDQFLEVQGHFFAQYVLKQPENHSQLVRHLASSVKEGNKNKSLLLGSMALRDSRFVDVADFQTYSGDSVLRDWWLQELGKVRKIQKQHPSHIFGLSSSNINIEKWLTYQFSHSGEMHFFSNMIFLIIFGGALELLVGGLALVITYLGAGLVAAGFFLVLSGASSIPLIGASGSISGIMALFCFLNWREPIRYFYCLFIPKPGYWGMIHLPAWIVLVMWGLSDFAGYLSSVNELGGVAYTAHLGGQISGVIVGSGLFFFRKVFPSYGQGPPPQKLESS